VATVTWEKIRQAALKNQPAPVALPSRYYIAGDFNSWTPQEMTSDPFTPGLFTIDIKLTNAHRADFQIVRNEDWQQCFYPNYPGASTEDPATVLGPDDMGPGLGLFWSVHGKLGDNFRVEFQRIVELDSETKKVSWKRL